MAIKFDYTEHLKNAYLKSAGSSAVFQSQAYTAGTSRRPFYAYVNPGHLNTASELEFSAKVGNPNVNTSGRWEMMPRGKAVWTVFSSAAGSPTVASVYFNSFYNTSAIALPLLVRYVFKSTSASNYAMFGNSTYICAIRVIGNIAT